MPNPHLTPDELRAKLDTLPRIDLAHTPTPLEELPRLRDELGGAHQSPRLFVKRDDLTGLAMGGNKVRHYEYEMPHILDAGYDTVINIMDYHSNNARLTAAAANKVGLRYVLVLKNAAHRKVQGNLLIDKLLGAELHLLDQFQSETADVYAADLKCRLEEEDGAKVYLLQEHLLPRIVGMVGYVRAGLELLDQIIELGLQNVHIYAVAGRSLCGLILVAKNLGMDWRFTGVTVNYDMPLDEYIFQHNDDIRELLDLPETFTESDMRVLDQFVGEGYGIMTQEVAAAMHICARTEALVLDPNYTGTTMSALIDDVASGNLQPDADVIFLHSGGLPAVFTYADELAKFSG